MSSTHSSSSLSLSLSLRVWDFKEQCWLPNSCDVEYRDTPLGHLYPDTTFAIGDVSGLLMDADNASSEAKKEIARLSKAMLTSEKKGLYTFIDEKLSPQLEAANFLLKKMQELKASIPSILDKGWVDEKGQHWQLVGASGSRKKGRCLFAVGGGDYFTRFFGSNSNAINYGSNLTTECLHIQQLAAIIKVVPDGEYGTGDCHGVASAQFVQYFLCDLTDVDTLTVPFQFRAVAKTNNWVAKGTIRYCPNVDGTGYSLVLPESCFKGNKVTVGEYTVNDLLFGVVHLAEVRRVKMSYSVTQFLPWAAIESDILPSTLKAAAQLNQLTDSPSQLAEYLCRTDSNANPTPDEDEEGEAEYVPPLALIAAADKFSALVPHHPWVLQRIQWMLQSRWTRLATAGAVRFNSSMTQPDDSLAAGEVCIPGLADGEEVIVFPYPCRWKHDLAVWTNRALPQWQNYQGVIVGSHKTMLTIARDFDGDWLAWLPASQLPAVRDAILRFEPAPELTKPAKEKVSGSLGEIAARAMDNQVGLITWAIAKAQASGNYQVIPELAQQLQIEVDSLKNVQRADMVRVNEIIESIEITPLWLSNHKNKDVYICFKMPDNPAWMDSISQLARAVNECWREPKYVAGKLKDYQYLFPEPNKNWRERAAIRLQEYGKSVAWAYQPAAKYKDKPVPLSVQEQVKMRLRGVSERYKGLLDKCSPEQRFQSACAFWHSSHWSNETEAKATSLVFLLCLPEILKRLGEVHIPRFRLFSHTLGEQVFTGEDVFVIQVKPDPEYISTKQVYDRYGTRIGSCNLSVPDGVMPISLYTKADSKGQLRLQECVVMDSSVVEEF